MTAKKKKTRVVYDERRFPLHWPLGWPRTRASDRKSARYQVSSDRACAQLNETFRLMDARNVVISSNVEIRPDGLPYANQKVSDPGVAVYWTDAQGVERSIGCDRWLEVRDNLRAIGLALEALRDLERTGASEIVRRAYSGFAALPSGIVVPKPWREVFNYRADERPSREDLDRRYRVHARDRHPDSPHGSHERFVELGAAYEAAKIEVG